MPEKRCSKCHTAKDTSEFGPSKQTSDGLFPQCRPCKRQGYHAYKHSDGYAERRAKYLKKYKRENWEAIREKERVRRARPGTKERIRDSILKWRASENGRARVRQYRLRRPETKKAHDAVRLAIIRGQIIKPSQCSRCNAGSPQAHHHLGYAPEHRLDVVWLCAKCHVKEHPKPRTPIRVAA